MAKNSAIKRLVTLVALVFSVLAISFAGNMPVAGATSSSAIQRAESADQRSPALVTPPVNDDFANATIIGTIPFMVDGLDTTDATTQVNDPATSCGSTDVPQQSHSVWFRYTPSDTGNHNINTLDSDYDTVLAVWTGSWGALNEQGCNDDDGAFLTSALNISLQSGTTYYIEAMSYGDDVGGSLNLAVAGPPPNDDFDNALEITGVPYSYSEVTDNATTADDDPSFDCDAFSGQGSHSVWFSLSSPYRRVLTASTLGPPTSNYDTVLGIFTGSRGNLDLVACNDDADVTTFQSQAQIALDASTTYFVEVVGFYSFDAGTLNFSADLGPICPDFVDPPGVGIEDIVQIANLWGQQQGPPYDYDGNGTITIYDIQQVTAKWGQDCLALSGLAQLEESAQ